MGRFGRSIKLPCPKVKKLLETVEVQPGIRSAFCMFCSEWHNWTHVDIEKLNQAKRNP